MLIRASFPRVIFPSLTPLPPPSVALQAIQTIATVKMSGKRLLQLINDILDAAKMKQGGLVIKHQQVMQMIFSHPLSPSHSLTFHILSPSFTHRLPIRL